MKGRILLLHSSSDLYGASKILVNTVLSLKNAGYVVHVILSESGPLLQELERHDVQVQVVKLGILRRKYMNVTGIINRLDAVYKAYRVLSRLVKAEKYDIIYSNTTAVLVGYLVAKLTKTKHIWHVHEIIEKPAFFSKFIGSLLKRSDLVIVVSDQVRISWAKVLGESFQKIKVIYNGLDYSSYLSSQSHLKAELGLSNDKFLIGMIGRVNSWKGQKYFLNIASLLTKKNDNYHFVMVGDAFPGYEYLYDELRAVETDLDLTSKVANLGFRTDIPNILTGLDLFILPSILPDPLPTVVLESMAAGTPVVATKHGGALEMVADAITGTFIPWDNAEVAANIIHDLVISGKTSQFGVAGKLRVLDEFSIEAFNENLVKAVNELHQ